MFTFLASSLAQVLVLAHMLLGIFAGLAVYADARKRQSLVLGLHPIWWAASAFMGSIMGVVAYWFVHYSSFAKADGESE